MKNFFSELPSDVLRHLFSFFNEGDFLGFRLTSAENNRKVDAEKVLRLANLREAEQLSKLEDLVSRLSDPTLEVKDKIFLRKCLLRYTHPTRPKPTLRHTALGLICLSLSGEPLKCSQIIRLRFALIELISSAACPELLRPLVSINREMAEALKVEKTLPPEKSPDTPEQVVNPPAPSRVPVEERKSLTALEQIQEHCPALLDDTRWPIELDIFPRLPFFIAQLAQLEVVDRKTVAAKLMNLELSKDHVKSEVAQLLLLGAYAKYADISEMEHIATRLNTALFCEKQLSIRTAASCLLFHARKHFTDTQYQQAIANLCAVMRQKLECVNEHCLESSTVAVLALLITEKPPKNQQKIIQTLLEALHATVLAKKFEDLVLLTLRLLAPTLQADHIDLVSSMLVNIIDGIYKKPLFLDCFNAFSHHLLTLQCRRKLVTLIENNNFFAVTERLQETVSILFKADPQAFTLHTALLFPAVFSADTLKILALKGPDRSAVSSNPCMNIGLLTNCNSLEAAEEVLALLESDHYLGMRSHVLVLFCQKTTSVDALTLLLNKIIFSQKLLSKTSFVMCEDMLKLETTRLRYDPLAALLQCTTTLRARLRVLSPKCELPSEPELLVQIFLMLQLHASRASLPKGNLDMTQFVLWGLKECRTIDDCLAWRETVFETKRFRSLFEEVDPQNEMIIAAFAAREVPITQKTLFFTQQKTL